MVRYRCTSQELSVQFQHTTHTHTHTHTLVFVLYSFSDEYSIRVVHCSIRLQEVFIILTPSC